MPLNPENRNTCKNSQIGSHLNCINLKIGAAKLYQNDEIVSS